jgi:polyhydroxyalkanoate synthesis regulator phasin
MNAEDKKLLKQVTLLGILKKKKSEGLDEVIETLVNSGSYSPSEAKKLVKELKRDGLINSMGNLTMKGHAKAKEAEARFKQ